MFEVQRLQRQAQLVRNTITSRKPPPDRLAILRGTRLKKQERLASAKIGRDKAQARVEALKLELQDLEVAIFQAEADSMPQHVPSPFLTGHHIEALAVAAHGMSAERQKLFQELLGEVFTIVNDNQRSQRAQPFTPPRALAAKNSTVAPGLSRVDMTVDDSPPSATKSDPGHSSGKSRQHAHSIGGSPLKEIFFSQNSDGVTSTNYHPTGWLRRTGKAPPRSADADPYQPHVVRTEAAAESVSTAEPESKD